MLSMFQISTRRDQKQGEQMRLNLELLDDHRAEQDYEELLQEEAQKMSVRGYTPKVGLLSPLIFLAMLNFYNIL